MMQLQAKRLPATNETLCFLSPYFTMPHVRERLDDRFQTYFGIYALMQAICSGEFRVYGAFDLRKPIQFLGFCFGKLEADGESYVFHTIWQRKVDVVPAILLCEKAMVEDYAADGITIRYAVGYIPDCNRAAQRMAKRAGCRDLGLRSNYNWLHDGQSHECREFRKELR